MTGSALVARITARVIAFAKGEGIRGMTEDEYDRLWRGLLTVWPRAFDRDDDGDLRAIWRGYLIRHEHGRVRAAIRGWMAERRNPPAVSDVLAALRAAERPEHHAVSERRCGQCDDGWVFLDPRGNEVARCPNGCQPTAYAAIAAVRHDHSEEESAARSDWPERAREVLAEARTRLRSSS